MVDHTTVTIPKELKEQVEELIADTGFQNVSEFTRHVLRDIAAAGPLADSEEYPETMETVRTRLRNLGYLPHDEEDT